jgi:DNA-binding IclR family transcriptional regulator
VSEIRVTDTLSGQAKGRVAGAAAQAKIGARTEVAILAAIAELTQPRGPTAPTIAERIGLKRAWTRRVVSRLIRGGLVAEDTRGGGLGFLTLTPRGWAALGSTAKPPQEAASAARQHAEEGRDKEKAPASIQRVLEALDAL